MHGYAAVAALILAIPAVMLWVYERLPRPSAWCFWLLAIAVSIAFPQWLDSAAGLTYSRSGLAALGAFTVVTGFCFFMEAFGTPNLRKLRKAFKMNGGAGSRPKQHYHRIRTPGFSLAFGSALILALGSLDRLVTGAGQSLTQTTSLASATIAQVRSGQAAKAVPHGERMTYLAIGVAVFVVLIFIAVHVERRKRAGMRGVLGRPGGIRPGVGGGGKPSLSPRSAAELTGRR